MLASIDTSRECAFVLKREQVKSIWDSLNTRIGPPRVTIKCADDLNREYENWKSFLAFENAPNKKIKELKIQARSEDYKKSASIEFADSHYRSINIRIDASETVVTNLYTDVCDVLEGTAPWYSRLARVDFFFVLLFVVVISWILMAFYSPITPEKTKAAFTLGQAVLATTAVTILLAGLAVLVRGLNKAKQRFFPIGYFAIGQGLGMYETDEKYRWGVVIAFLVSISASVVLSLFQ